MLQAWNNVAETFSSNNDVSFGDINLSEQQIRGNHNPGAGGWPTIKYFNKETGYEGATYNKKTDKSMCDELGDYEMASPPTTVATFAISSEIHRINLRVRDVRDSLFQNMGAESSEIVSFEFCVEEIWMLRSHTTITHAMSVCDRPSTTLSDRDCAGAAMTHFFFSGASSPSSWSARRRRRTWRRRTIRSRNRCFKRCSSSTF